MSSGKLGVVIWGWRIACLLWWLIICVVGVLFYVKAVRTALFLGKGCWLAFVRDLCCLCCLVSPHHPKDSDSKSNDHLFRGGPEQFSYHSVCGCVSMHTCVPQSTCRSEETLSVFLMVPLVFSVSLAAHQASCLWASDDALVSISHLPGDMCKCTTVSGFYLGSEDLCGKAFSWLVIFSVTICHLNNLNYFGLCSGDT